MTTPENTPVVPIAPSVVRSVVPYVVGFIVSFLASKGLNLDADAQLQISGLLTLVIGSLYTVVVRYIERLKPKAGVLLGNKNSPVSRIAEYAAEVEKHKATIDNLTTEFEKVLSELAELRAYQESAEAEAAAAAEKKAAAAAKRAATRAAKKDAK